ncbi:MAG: DUF4974 domain-containing protein [Cyclobacteriaceae bacterium]|nr:DUF4974 domain-containing protein [Cyclobacteriaceae bacterium]
MEEKPFRVITGDITTVALGTTFNINSDENAGTEVALTSGNVVVTVPGVEEQIDSLFLHPGEMVFSAMGSDRLLKSTFNIDEKICWKDGVLLFRDADYAGLINKLEHWYGVTISENKLPTEDWSFNGKFERETLENVLISLQFGHAFSYEIDGKNVKLKF